jgi:hypothetical protein
MSANISQITTVAGAQAYLESGIFIICQMIYVNKCQSFGSRKNVKEFLVGFCDLSRLISKNNSTKIIDSANEILRDFGHGHDFDKKYACGKRFNEFVVEMTNFVKSNSIGGRYAAIDAIVKKYEF